MPPFVDTLHNGRGVFREWKSICAQVVQLQSTHEAPLIYTVSACLQALFVTAQCTIHKCLDFSLQEDEEIDIDEMALQLDDNGNYTEEQLMMFDDATREALQDSEPEEEDTAQDNSSGPQAAERNMSQLEADLRDRYFSQETARAAQRRRIR